MIKHITNQRGFSFLELTIVLAIMGFLLLIGIPNYKAVADKSQNVICKTNQKLVEAQTEQYYFDHLKYPTDALTELKSEKYLKEIPVCPTEGKYEISEQDPIKVTCSVHKAENS